MTRIRSFLAAVAHYTWLVVVTVAYAAMEKHEQGRRR
jgi:hypothetical protein